MTEKGQTNQNERLPILLSLEPGDKRIKDAKELTTMFPEQLLKAHLYGSLVADAVIQNLLHTMKTTTSLSTLCGSANLATSKGTKN